MILFCSKCEKPVDDPDIEESVDGYLFSCTECDGPLALISYEAEADYLKNVMTSVVLGIGPDPDACGAECSCTREEKVNPNFTPDEALYLLHITDKQLGKVNNAACQLINIKTKLGGYTK